jgi:hypothetical protein
MKNFGIHILWLVGIFLALFVVIWYFPPILVCCTRKTLAALTGTSHEPKLLSMAWANSKQCSSHMCQKSATDVMILKTFSAKNLAKKFIFCSNYCKVW